MADCHFISPVGEESPRTGRLMLWQLDIWVVDMSDLAIEWERLKAPLQH